MSAGAALCGDDMLGYARAVRRSTRPAASRLRRGSRPVIRPRSRARTAPRGSGARRSRFSRRMSVGTISRPRLHSGRRMPTPRAAPFARRIAWAASESRSSCEGRFRETADPGPLYLRAELIAAQWNRPPLRLRAARLRFPWSCDDLALDGGFAVDRA